MNPFEPSSHSNIYMHLCSIRIRICICIYDWTKKIVSILSRFVGRRAKPWHWFNPRSIAQQATQQKENSGVKHWLSIGFFHYLLFHCTIQWKYLSIFDAWLEFSKLKQHFTQTLPKWTHNCVTCHYYVERQQNAEVALKTEGRHSDKFDVTPSLPPPHPDIWL